MFDPILLTSFATWKAHHRTNSSDELLLEITAMPNRQSLRFVRQLPVNLPVAQEILIAKLQQLRPQLLICCGMAETRRLLTVETQAVVGNKALKSDLDLEKLTAGLPHTILSQDAGRFVCNSVYHAMLNYLNGDSTSCKALFVHVPLLTSENRDPIIGDFRQMLDRLQTD